jgi:hypothetical protein
MHHDHLVRPRTDGSSPRRLGALALGALALLGAGAVRATPAAAASAPRATIVSVTASPAQLPARGGNVVVTVRVRNARTCVFRAQRGPFTSISDGPSVTCAAGRVHATLELAANTHTAPATLHFYVRARDALGRSVQKATTVVEAGASAVTPGPPPIPVPTQLTIGTTSLPIAAAGAPYWVILAASGGTAPYTWSLAAGSLPPNLALSAAGTLSGTPAGSGPTSFTVEVTDAAGAVAAAALSLEVNTMPPRAERSDNWSGYYVTGGPFTSVTGTFNVPSVAATRRSTDTAEWVGIDGAVTGNTSLIQAGVEERYDATSKLTHFFAWWEILPDAETLAPLTVQAGDQVTVTIGELASGLWQILLTDDTTGQSYTTAQTYDGNGTTAEWIVEAPTSAQTGAVLTVGRYTPNVSFSSLGLTGAESTIKSVEMVQNSVTTSVPSGLSANGFVVTYGGVPPPPP